MKSILIICLSIGLLIACSNNNAAEDAKVTAVEEKSKSAANEGTPQELGTGIVGLWKLKLEAYDENENKLLDEDEKKKGIKNNYTYRFHADGSCQIQQVYKGRYEVKTEKGDKILTVYRNRIEGEEDEAPVPDVYRIVSESKNEMVLLEKEGNLTFWVFERAG